MPRLSPINPAFLQPPGPAVPIPQLRRSLTGPSDQFDRQVDEFTKAGEGGGNVKTYYPFDIFLADAGGGDLTATIWPGTVNQILVSGYLSGVTVSSTGTSYLFVDVTTADGAITGASLGADTVAPDTIAPTQGTPPTSFKILIGLIVDGIAYRTLAPANITALPQEAFRVEKTSPTPGLPSYDIYYTWSI